MVLPWNPIFFLWLLLNHFPRVTHQQPTTPYTAQFSIPPEDSLRIVRGREVRIEIVPFFVLVLHGKRIHCGGTILNSLNVLTAAHCLKKTTLYVLGGYNTQSKDMQLVEVKSQFRHPNYREILGNDQTPAIIDFDVAVLRLAHHLLYTERVAPVRLAPQGYEVPPTGTKMIAIGVGATREPFSRYEHHVDIPNILFNVTLPIYDFNKCSDSYRHLNIKLTDLNFCAGFDQGRFDVCNGDSGGPLMYGKYQYGVVSYGIGCGRPGFPSVYTNIPRVYDWIRFRSMGTKLGGRIVILMIGIVVLMVKEMFK